MEGCFKFYIKDRACVGSGRKGRGGSAFIVYLKSECQEYEGMLETSTTKFNRFSRNDYFGNCTVVRNIKNGEYYIVDKESPQEALESLIRWSWFRFIFFTIITLISALNTVSLLHLVN